MKNQEQGRHSDKKWTKYVQKKALFSNYLNQQTGMREHLGLNGQCTQTSQVHYLSALLMLSAEHTLLTWSI